MKIAATELMAETTNSDGSFQGFSLRDLSLSLFLALPFLLLPPSDPSLPPYARLSCPEHEGRFPLTLMAPAAESSERTRTDMDARARAVGQRTQTKRNRNWSVGLPPSLPRRVVDKAVGQNFANKAKVPCQSSLFFSGSETNFSVSINFT